MVRSRFLALSLAACATAGIAGHAVAGKALSHKAAGHRVTKVVRDCDDCPQMVLLPAGSFLMGSPPDENGRSEEEGPRHRVHLAHPFAIGRYEITRGEWDRFIAATHYPSSGCNAEAEPVACVTWQDAWAYTLWLKAKTGKPYRLPTEAEWEYATRAGTTTARFWGDDPDQACRFANVRDRAWLTRNVDPLNAVHECDDGYVGVSPAGHYAPNPFGLYDTIGNVWEWVQDCWHPGYAGAPADGRAWEEPDCAARVLRGGATGGIPKYARSALRSSDAPDFVATRYGFRVARGW